ncbi:uncharacterized protein LOC107813264 isoform X1 [Nicotiana tabacum]|uniref:uncharacterized protein LOC107813264 isoform X1 n=1 Tax=Nicotiana tabacum TaxID=4097 RepID=UPI003F4E5821
MVTLNFFYKFMRLSKERMQQRMHEKLNEQKDVMEKNITMNIIARLQHQNPDLRLDPDMLRFSERSSVEAFSAQQVVVQVNSQPSAGSNNQGISLSHVDCVIQVKLDGIQVVFNLVFSPFPIISTLCSNYVMISVTRV